jgi:hypothetical protein
MKLGLRSLETTPLPRVLATGALLLAALLGPQPSLEARGAKRYLKKESTVDLSQAKTVFIGWIDFVPEDWSIHGYGTEDEWTTTIAALNHYFQRTGQTKWLTDRTVVGAKGKGERAAESADLAISFSDVRIDYDEYLVHLSIHFVDPKTNTELASIPTRPYYGDDWGFERYIRAALEEVNRKIQVEVTGQPGE